MNAWLPWLWLLLALALSVGEIFTAGFFLVCFGAGAAVAALVAFLGAGLAWQLATFVGVSTVALLLARPLMGRISNPVTHPVGAERMVGQHGIVVETIDPVSGHGVVRVGHERWSADASDGRPIAAGAAVAIVAVQGAHLKVRALAP
jgi:membrane protein implicated in regulation of membrane protease activity